MSQKKSALTDEQNRIFEENMRKDHDLLVELSGVDVKKCDICDFEFNYNPDYEYCPYCGYRLTLTKN